jgi:UDP-N-acetylmuramate dehydrogenase
MPTLLNNVPLAGKTTFGIGGPAQTYCAPSQETDVVGAIAWALKNKTRLLVLGRGSNLLVSDKGFQGLVIDLAAGFTGIAWDGICANCRAGALLHTLVKESVDRGLSGLEKLAGIPGSVGGAVVMNAGAFGQTVSGCLRSVRYVDCATATTGSASAPDLAAAYRTSIFKNAETLILSATFCFSPDDSGTAPASFREVLAKRKVRHPLDLPNCGSVFKNPAGAGSTAGQLIEQCGLKGATRGGAQVSFKHANFIVNLGAASADHVRSLIVHVQKTVFDKTGICLEPEVVFAGEFGEALFTPR